MSSQIFFKDGGAGLSSVKSTCAWGGIVASIAGDGIFATVAAGGGIVASVALDGSVAYSAGYGSAVVGTGVSGGLETGADGALCL